MTLEYGLDQDDYLQYYLYNASESKRIKDKRRRSLLIVISMFSVFAVLFFIREDLLLMYYFIACAFLSLFFYPLYLKRQYKKHYKKFVADTYKSVIGERTKITFTETHIETLGRVSESKINISEVGEIAEINDYFYLKMKTGGALIISKVKIQSVDNLKTFLVSLSKTLGVQYTEVPNWKWK